MEKILITKNLKVFTIEDIKDVLYYIGDDGYFADSIEDLKGSEKKVLDKILIEGATDEYIFYDDDEGNSYKYFAVEDTKD